MDTSEHSFDFGSQSGEIIASLSKLAGGGEIISCTVCINLQFLSQSLNQVMWL